MNQKSTVSMSFRITAALAMAAAVRGAMAQAIVAYTPGTTYTQDFNSLATYSSSTTLWSNNMTPPEALAPIPVSPVQISNYVNGVDNTQGYTPVDLTGPSTDFFQQIQTISNMTGWYAINYGGNSTPLTYTVDDGSAGTAALTAFFNPSLPMSGTNNNMALGAVTASGSGNVEFGVELVNNGSISLNTISLSYLGELFHQDTGAKTLNFGYTITNATNSIPTASLTTYGAMNVGGFATGTGSYATFATQSLSIASLPLSSNWTPGSALWLTWTMNSAGGGQGLAIDNLNFSASYVAGAPILIWNVAGSGSWDTTSSNWTGASSIFSNTASFNVTFGTIAAPATITINASAVAVASSVTINNGGAGVYTFTGGAIAGTSVSLNVQGGGTVRLTSANTYGLATNVTSGVLIVDNNNELGASTAQLNLAGGTLQLAGNLSAGSRVLAVSAAGGTFNTNGSTASFGATSAYLPQIRGTLEVSGGGTLNLGIEPAFGTSAAPAGQLQIDAGSTVVIQGNGRSSPTDMWNGGVINGTLILQTAAGVGGRFNFESATANGGSVVSGIGVIQVPTGSHWINEGNLKGQLDGSGAIISNTSASFGADVDVNIDLNSLNLPFAPTDVTNQHAFDGTLASTVNNFITVIGGTKKGNAGIGPTFSLTVYGGVISGNSDISVGNDYKSGGSGNIEFANNMTYTGATMLNGGGAGLPVLYLGVNNALPTTTDLVFGSITGAGTPSLDMNGFNQTINSLSVGIGTNSPNLNQINNSGPNPSTLTIGGATTPYYPYNGQINDDGPTLTDVNGNPIAYAGSTTALVKAGTSTLVLGMYLNATHTTLSDYSGGTTVQGGVLQIPFDGAMGAPQGALTFDGGTITMENPFLQYSVETTSTWTSARPITVTANGGTINTPAFTALDSSSVGHSLVSSVVFTGNASYSSYAWGGNLHLTGAPGSNVTINGGAPVTVNSGAITVDPNVTLTLNGTAGDPITDSSNASRHVAFSNSGNLQFTGTGNITAGAITGTGTLTQLGTGTTTLAAAASYSGPTIISAGLLNFSGGVAHSIGKVTGVGTLQVDAGATLTSDGVNLLGGTWTINGNQVINSSGSNGAYGAYAAGNGTLTLSGTSEVTNLSFGGSGHLNLMNNALIVESTGATGNKATLLAQISADISSGAITSSTAASNAAYALVLADNADLSASYFGGIQVDANSIIITQALIGDANLDGAVTPADLLIWANNFNKSPSYSVAAGDLNSDGSVTPADLLLWANNFNNSIGGNGIPSLASGGSLGSGGGLSGGGLTAPGGGAATPEPASLALLGLGAAGMLIRRKRR